MTRSLWHADFLFSLFAVAHKIELLPLPAYQGTSVLTSVLNYETGQEILVWYFAQFQKTELVSTWFCTILPVYHVLLVLLHLGLVGATISPHAVDWKR